MSSPIIYFKKLIRKGSRADSFSRRKPADKSYCGHRERQIQLLNQDFRREHVFLSKRDSESFGFVIRTYGEESNTSDEDALSCVCSVKENSVAEKAGLKTGDVIISVNSVCVEGLEHQQIVDLIQTSYLLKMEIVRGTTLKQKELQKKLHYLQTRLNEKRAELEMLIEQEERLRKGHQSCANLSSEHLPLPIPLC